VIAWQSMGLCGGALFSKGYPWPSPGSIFFGCGLIRSRLFWQRTYPALIQEHGIAQVELFHIVDASNWDELDLYVGFDPSNLAASLLIRRQVSSLEPSSVGVGLFSKSADPAWATSLRKSDGR
jgi:hypothetical protein